jgi:uncharacterized protein (TIGR03435 family)
MLRILVAALIAGTVAQAQTPGFEVVSIRPGPSVEELTSQFRAGQARMGMAIQGDTVNIGAVTVGDLVELAFRVKRFQVVGPDWLRRDRFDIVAKLPAGSPHDQVPDMLHAMLKERFGLVAHWQPIETPAYALVVANSGPKLKASDAAAAKPPEAATPALDGSFRFERNSGITISGQTGTTRMSMGPDGLMRLTALNVTMAGLAQLLTGFVDRVVVDQTKLTGTYEVVVEISQAEAMQMLAARGAGVGAAGAGTAPPMAGGAPSTPVAMDPGGTTTLAASLAHLGLKLERRNLPIEKVVIDHVERAPTPN